MIRTMLSAALLTGLVASAAPCSAQEAANNDFPAAWHFYGNNPDRWAQIEPKLKALVGKDAPALEIGDWHGDGGKSIEDMKGDIILIDFWATWCGPCKAAVPAINEIKDHYAGSGVKVIGVCGTRGAETMTKVADDHHMAYPTAADQEGKTAKAYGVQWWPYFMLVDTKGKVRAAGISTGHLEDAVRKMLELEGKTLPPKIGDTGGDVTAIVPADWLEGKGELRETLTAMHGKAAPKLEVSEWINADAMALADLEGKIVVLDFWATWCGPCIASIPKNNKKYDEYKDRGVVFIGVCHPRGVEKMPAMVDDKGIRYPVCADPEGKTIKTYNIKSFPDYTVIGRDGKVVAADVRNDKVWELVERLLDQDSQG